MLGLGESDERLIGRAAAGDREAFRRLYRSLYEPVRGFVDRRVLRPEDVEDLVSAVFHKLLEKLDRFDPNRGSVKAFAISIARNAVIDHARTRHPSEELDRLSQVLPDLKPSPLDLLLRREDLAVMAELVASLPAETRELLILRFGDGLSHAEIASVLGLSPEAVRQRISRALRELKSLLAEARGRSSALPRREEARTPSDRPPGRDVVPAPERTEQGALHVRI